MEKMGDPTLEAGANSRVSAPAGPLRCSSTVTIIGLGQIAAVTRPLWPGPDDKNIRGGAHRITDGNP